MSENIKDWADHHIRQQLYTAHNDHKLDHSRAAYREREALRTGQQNLHVHVWHMHMIKHHEAMQHLLWTDDLFAPSTQRQ